MTWPEMKWKDGMLVLPTQFQRTGWLTREQRLRRLEFAIRQNYGDDEAPRVEKRVRLMPGRCGAVRYMPFWKERDNWQSTTAQRSAVRDS